MAEITHDATERYLFVTGHNGFPNRDEMLSYEQASNLVAQGIVLSIYVKGWRAPWPCSVEAGVFRAECPTAPSVCPRIVQGAVS